MLKKLLPILILLLVCPFSGHAQTSLTGLIVEAPFASRPVICASGDLFFATDTFVLYQCGPTNTWGIVAGNSAPPQGTIQEAGSVGGSFAASPLFDNGTSVTSSLDMQFRGPNPSVDIRAFNARPVNVNVVPATTGTINATQTTLNLASASSFQNKDGITVVGGGPVQSMSTPSAPTVTPSCASNLTGTGLTVPVSGGGTPYAYSLSMVDTGRGYTAASVNGTTSTGFANLGARSTTWTSSASGTSNVFTATVGSTAELAAGCLVNMEGSTDDQEFGGWKIVLSVIDLTHFTYQSGVDASRGISTTSSTGGTIRYWLCNHIVMPTPTGAGFQYLIFGRTSGSMAFLKLSYPANLGYTDASYNTWDDFGATMMTNPPTPWWAPSAPPVSPINDELITTIVSGGGTTTLTLSAAATTSVTSAPVRFDNAPNIIAAFIRANSFSSNGGGTIRFPVAVETNNALLNYCYEISSYLVLDVNTVIQDGSVCLADTVQFSGAWYGTDASSNREGVPTFGFRPHIGILVTNSDPGIYLKSGGSLNKVNVQMFQNGGIGVFNGPVGPSNSQLFDDDSFTSTGTTDFMSIPFYDYASSISGGFGGDFHNCTFSTGPNQVLGSTSTPAFISKFNTQWNFNTIYANRRGFAFYPPPAGLNGRFYMGHEIQGNITPLITLGNVLSGNIELFFTLQNVWIDTGDTTLANLTPSVNSIGANITFDSGNFPSGGQPLVTGNALTGSINFINFPIHTQNFFQLGQNRNVNIIGGSNVDLGQGSFGGIRAAGFSQTNTTYSTNHTLMGNEGTVRETGSGTTITANSAMAGQEWNVYNTSAGTVTIAITSGSLFCNGGSCVIPSNQGVHISCDGTNCNVAGLTLTQTAIALKNTSNTFTTGIQDFSAVTEFRPKSGTTSAIPATCSSNPMDVYIANDAVAGQNWYFCTSTNTWTQQLNSGSYILNTYSGSHTLAANEQWANFNITATATVQHALTNHRWVVYNTSSSNTVTLAPDSGNITLNGVTASTASIAPGLGVQVACDGTNCFAWGIGSSGGGGSGTITSCTVNGVAYYSALTTVTCVSPPTSPNGVPETIVSTPSGGVSQPPAMALPGIIGRAVSGSASTDTILSTDCNPNRVEYVGSAAVAVTLPTAVTLGVPKCVFKLVNNTSPAQTVTVQPTTWTINGNSTLNLTFGQQLWVYVDPNSATNWVADQTDLFGNVSGAAVPASAKIIGSNSSSQLVAAGLNNTHIYVGNASNLPVDVALSGDASISNTGAITITKANGGTFPTSANVIGTNGSNQPVTATAHNIVLPWECADSSGSGSAQVCNTSPTFTPVAGDSIIYTTTTANTGTALTVNVNSLGAKPVAKWQTTTTLAANDIRSNTEVILTYDGTNWELTTIGNAPSGGGSTTPCNTTNLSLQYDNSNTFGCVAEFTYASSTITASATGKLDLTSASVTAGFHLPSATGAAPTNGGIVSYDQTCNKIVFGNATNTSSPTWVTSAPTSTQLVQFSGTCGLVVGTTTLPNGVTATTQSANDNSTKVSTTAYTDTAVANAIAAVNPAVAVLVATTGSNLVGTYSNGVSGIGATFTITATGTFTLDGVTINTLGQRVLLKDQTSGFQNGVYTATVVGTTGVSAVFTRALDYDQPSDINSTGIVPVQSGTANANTSWLLTSTVNTVGTDALTYVQFSIAPTSLVTAANTLTNNIPAIGAGSKTLSAGYTFTPGTVTSGHLACYTSSGTVGNCTGLAGVIGVFTSSTTWTANGETSISLDATVNVVFGDNLCVSSTSFGTAHDNGTNACTTGLGIGIVKTTASSVSSATAFVALR